jgi:hypothetical protein
MRTFKKKESAQQRMERCSGSGCSHYIRLVRLEKRVADLKAQIVRDNLSLLNRLFLAMAWDCPPRVGNHCF